MSMPRLPRSLAGILILVLLLSPGGCAERPVEVEGVPSWLPIYPGSDVSPMFETPTEQGSQGAVSFTIPATARDAISFYRDKLEATGFEVKIIPFRSDLGRGARIEGGDSKTGFHAIFNEEEGETASAIFNYTQAR